MDAWEIILGDSKLFLGSVFVIGLVIGSFLNVVIYRLPIMLEREWRRECEEFLGLPVADVKSEPVFNLVTPNSQCPHCGHNIQAHENIPVLSYILLGGKCGQCKSPISIRYPVVEVITALVSVALAWKLGASLQTLWALPLTWMLVCLSMIDLDRFILPDVIVLPLLWIGLFLSLFGIFSDTSSSIIGALAGYLSLWLVYQAYKQLTGKIGMGHGDFKLLAMFGAWLGWQSLLLIVMVSSILGAVTGVLMIVLFNRDRSAPIPFGPFICVAGWIALLWGRELTDVYLHMTGAL